MLQAAKPQKVLFVFAQTIINCQCVGFGDRRERGKLQVFVFFFSSARKKRGLVCNGFIISGY